MRILVNYNAQDDNYKNVIAQLLQMKGFQAVATNRTFTIAELQDVAKKARCDGILLANESTLENCVNSTLKVSLDKYRGSRLNFSIPAIVGAPLNHLRIVKHGRWLYEKDLDKLKQLKTPVVQLNYSLCDTEDAFSTLYKYAASSIVISLDIETDSNNRITCIGISLLGTNLKTRTFIIPFIDFGVDHYASDDLYKLAIQTMQRICKLPQPKLFWNGGYDALLLISYHAEPVNFTLDGLAIAHATHSELPKTLDFRASIHLHDYYYWKDEADESRKKNDIQGYWSYCARDAWNTLRIFLAQVRETPAYAIKNYQMLFKMVYPYMYCNYEGVLVDQEKRLENKVKAQAIVDKLLSELRVMSANPEFNPNSSKQVAELLFDVIGAKPIKKKKKDSKTGKYVMKVSTDEKTLKKISDQHPLIALFVDRILEYRGEYKAISTYFEFMQHENRMLYGLDAFGTETARAACRQSSFRIYDILEKKAADRIKNLGAQIQNIPGYAKNMLIADEGFELAEADNNKSEARCVALLSACKGLQAALGDKDKDFYRVLGTIFFGLAYSQVTTELRNKVLKRIVHGRNYLMGDDTFIDNVGYKQIYEGAKLLGKEIGVGKDFKTVKDFVHFLLAQYNEPFPEIEEWYKEIKLEILRNNTLTSPMGYTRYFFGDVMKDHQVFRSAVAHAPQNLSVMILNKGVWKVYTELVLTSNGEFRLKAQIHDSIFCQWPPAKRDYYKAKLQELMNNTVMVKGKLLSIPVDINTGKSWLDLKS